MRDARLHMSGITFRIMPSPFSEKVWYGEYIMIHGIVCQIPPRLYHFISGKE
jgi:hypothetical protein